MNMLKQSFVIYYIAKFSSDNLYESRLWFLVLTELLLTFLQRNIVITWSEKLETSKRTSNFGFQFDCTNSIAERTE